MFQRVSDFISHISISRYILQPTLYTQSLSIWHLDKTSLFLFVPLSQDWLLEMVFHCFLPGADREQLAQHHPADFLSKGELELKPSISNLMLWSPYQTGIVQQYDSGFYSFGFLDVL